MTFYVSESGPTPQKEPSIVPNRFIHGKNREFYDFDWNVFDTVEDGLRGFKWAFVFLLSWYSKIIIEGLFLIPSGRETCEQGQHALNHLIACYASHGTDNGQGRQVEGLHPSYCQYVDEYHGVWLFLHTFGGALKHRWRPITPYYIEYFVQWKNKPLGQSHQLKLQNFNSNPNSRWGIKVVNCPAVNFPDVVPLTRWTPVDFSERRRSLTAGKERGKGQFGAGTWPRRFHGQTKVWIIIRHWLVQP